MTATAPHVWRKLSRRVPLTGGMEIPRGADAAWHWAAGAIGHLVPRRGWYFHQARRVLALADSTRHLSDARLRRLLTHFALRFRLGRANPDSHRDRLVALALLRQAAARLLQKEPFCEQIAGALALYDGCLVEMATGEGKSLTATLPAIMVGWAGHGCHVITVNDYLARRDAEEFAPFYQFCGLRVDYIEQEMEPRRRQLAYAADVTYLTNKEVCADFLRDRLALGGEGRLAGALLRLGNSAARRQVQRGLHFAIVDEADSVLIDEAVTPLIISSDHGDENQLQAYQQALRLAEALESPRDYRLERRHRQVELTDRGARRLAELLENIPGIWRHRRRGEELVVQALTAKNFFLRDKHYVIQNEKIIIVDEYTGRLMPDRYWRDGIHQAVETREGLAVHASKETLARISYQRFFRLYEKFCGMSGTLAETRAELWHIYRRPLVVLPQHRPCIRRRFPVHVWSAERHKWSAVLEEIRRLHGTGRPILVGTRSVQVSEQLSRALTAAGLEHCVLNAVRHAEEAQIIAAAGKAGRITVATNMAGRGTDIRLDREALAAGGLHVIATEFHEAGRIDRQLAGRAGRQGDPGSSAVYASLADHLFITHALPPARLSGRIAGNREFRRPSGLPAWLGGLLAWFAQYRATRLSRRQRKSVALADHWLDESLHFAGPEI